ncbi:MAG: hypothetical protein B6U89_03995 [Desulfurococcales archaeon ex4484_58]|nr:MAG: hypothetical protein B6U89_03995 [Desulfurococcales archaeon ex4484_58]
MSIELGSSDEEGIEESTSIKKNEKRKKLEDLVMKLDYADKLLNEGLEFLKKNIWWNSAEKIWGAVKIVTDELSKMVKGKPLSAKPRNITARKYVEELLLNIGFTEEEAKEYSSIYIDVRDRLHGAVFYGRVYVDEMNEIVDRAVKYCKVLSKKLREKIGVKIEE